MPPAPLAASPYRTAMVLRRMEGPPRRPPWRAAALVSVIVAGAASSRETAVRHGAGDDPRAGAPVEHARLLAGGDGLCALTAMRDGTHQVVCAEADEVSHGLDRRRVSHAWRSPPLAQLVSCGSGETQALGLTADGRVVRFARGGAEALPVVLPPLAAHGPITALSSTHTHFTSHSKLVAVTRDGAVLGLPARGCDVVSGAPWREVLPAQAGGVSAVAWLSDTPCAVRADGVWCAASGVFLPSDTIHLERALAGTSLVEVAGSFPWLCARDRAGSVRCVRREESPEGPSVVVWRPWALEGAPLVAESIVASTHDLCVRGRASRWWCVAGPSADAPVWLYEARLALHPEPLLDGAVEVALGQGNGCARWPGGEVRCWGRHLRGGSFAARGPVEIPAARDVAAVSVDDSGACALRRGEAWCWRDFGSARPRRVALPGEARVLDAPYVAVGATVHRIHHDGHATALPNPRGDDAAIESIAQEWAAVCARRVDGRVTCWHEEAAEDDMDPRGVRMVPRRVPALEGFARFGASLDGICAWDPGREGRCRDWEVPVDPLADAPGHWRVQRVPSHTLDAPTRLDGDCVVYPDGHRDCTDDGSIADHLGIATPDWALDPNGEFARLHRRGCSRCVVLADRRVACRIEHVAVGRGPQRQEYAILFWRVMPVLRDVRAVSATRMYALRNRDDPFACAIQQDGHVFCWGSNRDDALSVGDSDRAPPLVPLRR